MQGKINQKHRTSVVILTADITERVVMFAKIYRQMKIPFNVIYSGDPFDLEVELPVEYRLRTENQQSSLMVLESIDYCFIHYFALGPDLLSYNLLVSGKGYVYDYKDILSMTDLQLSENLRTLEKYVLLNANMITARDPRAHEFFDSCGNSEHSNKIEIIPDYCIFDRKLTPIQKSNSIGGLKLVATGGFASEEWYGQDAGGISIVVNKLLENPAVSIEIIGGYSAAQRSPSVPLLRDSDYSRITFKPHVCPRVFFSRLSSYDLAIHAFNGDYLDTEQDNNNCFFNKLNKIASSSRLLTYAAAALPIIHGNSDSFNYGLLRDKAVLIGGQLDELNKRIDEFVSSSTGFVTANLTSSNASYREGSDSVRIFLEAYLDRFQSDGLSRDPIRCAIEDIE